MILGFSVYVLWVMAWGALTFFGVVGEIALAWIALTPLVATLVFCLCAIAIASGRDLWRLIREGE